MKVDQKKRLMDFFNDAKLDNNVLECINLDEIDYYSTFCKALASNKVFRVMNCSLCLFKYNYYHKDSIIMIFSIPSPSNPEAKDDTRHISQKVMELLKLAEDTFITLDYIDLKDVKEDKFNYLMIIKEIA
jgi:hypothetical protein